MTSVAERLRLRAKRSYGVEAAIELLVSALFAWGTFAAESISPGWRVLRAGIAILFFLGAIQSFERWRDPETEKALSDSVRRILQVSRVTVRIVAAVLALGGGFLCFLVATSPARDLATDLLIVFAILIFVDYCLGQIARD